jgi:regulator of RNase E activity RraA
MEPVLTQEQFETLQRLDSCTLANAIETFNVRLRNEGFSSDTGVRCLFPHLPPMLGYAVTGRIRTGSPPLASSIPPPPLFQLRFEDRTDWWEYVMSIPAPRVLVLEDIDQVPGAGAFMGDVHANICRALGFTGYVTNGAVRDVDAVERAGFHFFAGHVSVSHAYAHLVDFKEPVRVGGMRVDPGVLIHGDRHGLQTVPAKVAARIPDVAAHIHERDERIVALCQSAGFSMEKLRVLLKEVWDADSQMASNVAAGNNKTSK